jgi:hypothetical protein
MLYAHSYSEAQLYLKITGCEKCSPKSPNIQEVKQHSTKPSSVNVVRVCGPCSACGAVQELDFAIEHDVPASAHGRTPAINLTEKPSRIIDVGQWLTLAQLFIQEGKSEKDKGRARYLNLQAAQCLDEALKFYDDLENDLPPASAFYCESSRRRFRESPQHFSRGRLISDRRKLPIIFDEPSS